MSAPLRVYPCTIVPARYQGTYEGAKWLAFALDAHLLPEEAFADDLACCGWWVENGDGVGKGESPNEAYRQLCLLEKPLQAFWIAEDASYIYEQRPWPGYLWR